MLQLVKLVVQVGRFDGDRRGNCTNENPLDCHASCHNPGSYSELPFLNTVKLNFGHSSSSSYLNNPYSILHFAYNLPSKTVTSWYYMVVIVTRSK